MPKSIRIIGSGINPSSTTATEDDVLMGKIFIDNEGNEATGRIPDRSFSPNGDLSIVNINCGTIVDYGNGYYNHPFSVKANSLASQTPGNATTGQILTGKTAWVNGVKLTGTMPDKGAVTGALNCGGSYTIPAGYHNGSGKITANSLASQTSGTAQASQILTGKTAWVNGTKVTGIMANKGAVTGALNCGGSYTIPAGYHNGSGKITANALSGQTSGTATSSDILSGKTAWVNGSKISGGMANKGAITATVDVGKSYTIPAGYHNGSGKITAGGNITNLTPGNIKKGVTILGITGTWEGYVASSTDLYYNGVNNAQFVGDYEFYPRFMVIRPYDNPSVETTNTIISTNLYDFRNVKCVKISLIFTQHNSVNLLKMRFFNEEVPDACLSYITYGSDREFGAVDYKVYTIPLSNVDETNLTFFRPKFVFTNMDNVWLIDRIWYE